MANFLPLATAIGSNSSQQRQMDDKDNIERQKAMANLANVYSEIQARKLRGQQPTMLQDQQGNWWAVPPNGQPPTMLIPARQPQGQGAGLAPMPTVQTKELEGGLIEYSYTDPDGKPVVKVEKREQPQGTSQIVYGPGGKMFTFNNKTNKLEPLNIPGGESGVVTKAPPSAPPDQETLQAQATLMRQGVPVTNFVSGFSDHANMYRSALWKEVARQAKEAGDPVGEQSARMAARVANQAALTQLTKQRASILSFEKTTDKQFDMILSQSKKVPRSGSPLLNQYEQWLTTRVAGDVETQRLFNLIGTTTAEYAKVMTGNTGATASTDSARAEAGKLLNAAFSEDTLSGVIDTMRQEMGNRKSGMDEQIGEIRLELGGGAGTGKPKAKTGGSKAPSEMSNDELLKALSK